MKKFFCLYLTTFILTGIQSQKILHVKDFRVQCKKYNHRTCVLLSNIRSSVPFETIKSISVQFDDEELCSANTISTQTLTTCISNQPGNAATTRENKKPGRVFLVKTRMPELEDRYTGLINMPFIKLAIGL